MFVYNIRKEKYANALIASGMANRWNKNEQYVIYTGSSRSLSTLELVVHRSGISIDHSYKLLVIEIDCSLEDILEISMRDLPKNWRAIEAYPTLQKIGSDWYIKQEYLVMKVPSSIVPKEYNYLINTKHPLYTQKVKIHEIENYQWDKRLL